MEDKKFSKYQEVRSKIEYEFNKEERKEVLEMLNEDIPKMED